jgi:hypothetical protein
MEIDSFILPRDEVEPSVYRAELVALKTIVGVMATELAKWHEQVGELSAQSYVSALEGFCVDALTNADLRRSDDLGAHAFRLTVIKHVNAILYGRNLARDLEMNGKRRPAHGVEWAEDAPGHGLARS